MQVIITLRYLNLTKEENMVHFLAQFNGNKKYLIMWLSIMMLQLTTLTVLFSGKVQNHKMEIFHSSSKLICEQYLMGEVNYFLCNPIKLHSMQD